MGRRFSDKDMRKITKSSEETFGKPMLGGSAQAGGVPERGNFHWRQRSFCDMARAALAYSTALCAVGRQD
jgi:hypothetical protein